MKRTYCLLAMLWLAGTSFALPVRPLFPGDKVPDLPFRNMLFHAAASAKLGDFEGKLVILDFMATNCTGCIKALPRIDSLQRKYGDRLQVLLVTREAPAVVKAFFTRYSFVKNIRLPVICKDSLLERYFPFLYLSHEVWIGPGGKVKAITKASYVTGQNIETALARDVPEWPVKKDNTGYDFSLPMQVANPSNVQAAALPSLYSMQFTGSLANAVRSYSVVIDSNQSVMRATYINHTIPELCKRVLPFRPLLTNSRILLPPHNTSRYYNTAAGTDPGWKSRNAYCYEQVLPLKDSTSAKRRMLADIAGQLGIMAKLDSVTISCLELRYAPDSLSLPLPQASSQDASHYLRLSEMLAHMDNAFGLPPVIDHTGLNPGYYVLPISIDMLRDTPALQRTLARYGLQLTAIQQKTECLVISEIL